MLINFVKDLFIMGICWVWFCNFLLSFGIIKLIVLVVLVEWGIVLFVVECVV